MPDNSSESTTVARHRIRRSRGFALSLRAARTAPRRLRRRDDVGTGRDRRHRIAGPDGTATTAPSAERARRGSGRMHALTPEITAQRGPGTAVHRAGQRELVVSDGALQRVGERVASSGVSSTTSRPPPPAAHASRLPRALLRHFPAGRHRCAVHRRHANPFPGGPGQPASIVHYGGSKTVEHRRARAEPTARPDSNAFVRKPSKRLGRSEEARYVARFRGRPSACAPAAYCATAVR